MTESHFRVLALDYGTKRIGIALSDEGRMLASARGTIANGPNAIADILQLISKENVKQVLLGIPMTLANTESDMTREVRKFEQRLRVALEPLGINLTTRDERLTSV